MKNLFLISILAFSLFLSGCSQTEQTSDKGVNKEDQTGLPNPAAIFCEENGGTLIDVERDGGQDADCKLKDGTVCPQWDYYKGECGKDGEAIDNSSSTKVEPVKSDDITVIGINAGDTLSSPVTIEGKSDLERIVVELRNENHDVRVSEVVNTRDGEYKVNLNFYFSNTKGGFLVVYEEGNKMNTAEIPVKYSVIE